MYRLIVPLDGSPRAEQALALALVLAPSLGGQLTLAQILNTPVIFDPLAGSMKKPAADYLESIAARLPDSVVAETAVREGDPARELMALAETSAETIIVMSTHGRTGLGRLVFGSVADKVVRAGSVPVALVREPVRPARQLERLLLPLDGSTLAEEPLALALRLARRSGATLHLVRVLSAGHGASVAAPDLATVDASAPASGMDGRHVDEARGYLDQIAQHIRQRGLRATWEIRYGRAGEEIVRMAETIGANLILMSTHGRGGIERWAFGSVTNEVLQGGKIPILVMPPRAVQAARGLESYLAREKGAAPA